MSESTVFTSAQEQRNPGGGDRRLLHRGDQGRRDEDASPTENKLPPSTSAPIRQTDDPRTYLLLLGAVFVVLWGAVLFANYLLNPLIYSGKAQAKVAEEFLAGNNFGVFDLNIDMRGLRREHIARLTETPEIVVIGASHWQEGRTSLLPGRKFYNAHVHRDYYEDILAVSEMLIANDRLPKTLIISIRDLTFTPISTRANYLWLPALPEYRAMARRLGVESHSWFDTFFVEPWLDLTSLPSAWERAVQLLLAEERPGPTRQAASRNLDILSPGGFIRWSAKHEELFTKERAVDEALLEFEHSKKRRIEIDPAAVNAVDQLLTLLRERDVRVVLVHPPFNPVFYDNIIKTPYGDDMKRVIEVTADLAADHGIPVIGSFDPRVAGCDSSMFIDSQHSRPACLGNLLSMIPEL